MSYEINLSGSITENDFQELLADYNADHTMEFALSGSGQNFFLVGGDDIYCEGDLSHIAFFWEGYVSGQGDGDTSLGDLATDS